MKLSPGEVAFALLVIGGDAFFGIFTLEAELLEFALDGQGLGEGDLSARLDGAFNSANGLPSFLGRPERFCVVHNLFPVNPRRPLAPLKTPSKPAPRPPSPL